MVNGKVINGTQQLLDAWIDRFSNLAKFQAKDSPQLMELQNQIDGLLPQSMENEEFILDVPFSMDEVEGAVKKLKKRKVPGHDNLLAEHLIEGGPCVITWLTGIMNAIIDHEYIPESFKCDLVVPIYKGAGKDPLATNSYRGITLSPVFSKVLEFLILERLGLVFMEANIPHVNQSAYRKKVSCEDAIFATHEVIARYLKGWEPRLHVSLRSPKGF